VDAALARTIEFDRLVRRGTPKDKLLAEFAELEKALVALAVVAAQNPAAKLAAAGSLGRAETAFHQLAAAVGVEDNDPARVKRRLIRLGDTLDDAADDLRTLCADQIPNNDRALDRAIGQFARESRLLARRVRDDVDPDFVKRTYAAMGERWADALALLGRVRPLAGAIRELAVRIDGLHRRTGAVLNLPPFPPGTNPLVPARPFAFAVGSTAGSNPHVIVFADEKGTVAYNFFAYDKAFDGGARVAMADLNGDGVPDLIVTPGPTKGPAVMPVRVFDGRDMHLLIEFVPFPNWQGGLQAAGADLTRDGKALLAVTADGTQEIKVFDLAQGKEISSFFAHNPKVVTGGVRLAWGDVDGDGIPDLLTVNTPSTAVTTVKVFSGKNAEVIAEFPAVDNRYKGGAFIAAADIAGTGRANPVIGLDAGTIPLVRVVDARGTELAQWFAYDEKFRGGVRVAVSGRKHIITGPGFGLKNSPLKIFDFAKPKAPVEIVPFPGFDGGLNVGAR
jgi:hypothetical protein